MLASERLSVTRLHRFSHMRMVWVLYQKDFPSFYAKDCFSSVHYYNKIGTVI
ncbi:MAG: hypothetical protein VX070_04265 [Bacteroidota bacterium]|nr:hypothetical protein [Bacteroidota bacterium]